jgi:hypothetical protein
MCAAAILDVDLVDITTTNGIAPVAAARGVPSPSVEAAGAGPGCGPSVVPIAGRECFPADGDVAPVLQVYRVLRRRRR